MGGCSKPQTVDKPWEINRRLQELGLNLDGLGTSLGKRAQQA